MVVLRFLEVVVCVKECSLSLKIQFHVHVGLSSATDYEGPQLQTSRKRKIGHPSSIAILEI